MKKHLQSCTQIQTNVPKLHSWSNQLKPRYMMTFGLDRLACLILLFVMSFGSNAQDSLDVEHIRENYIVNISKTDESITLDGELNEQVWQSADIATDFWSHFPYILKDVKPLTEVRLVYTDDYLYIGAKMYQTAPTFIHSLKRDEYWESDALGIVIDPLNTKTNSYFFGCTAGNVQMDALWSQSSRLNIDWNNKWYTEVYKTSDYWSVEFAIPLKILKYNKSFKEWGINFIRNYNAENQYHNWTSVPNGYFPVEAPFAGTLAWDEAPKVHKGNFNLIPYATTSLIKVKDEELAKDFNIGIDAKVAVTSTMNLDITLNPDFSQVEADELVTNITRFSIFLPEKRNFFLENSDIFADYGSRTIRPFFSRKIGLDNAGNNVPILYGLRLNGNLTTDVRLGVMNVQSRMTDDSFAQNQSAVSVQKRFGRSYVQGMFLNRQAMDGRKSIKDDFGRNVSLEAAYISDNGNYSAWGGYNNSYKHGYNDLTRFYKAGFSIKQPNWEIFNSTTKVEENYFTDLGFIARINNYDAERDTSVRIGFTQSFTTMGYNIRPQKGKISKHGFSFVNYIVYNTNSDFNERLNEITYEIEFREGQRLDFDIESRSEKLIFPFSFTGAEPLPADTYNTFRAIMGYGSDKRKNFSYGFGGTYGGFYNGTLKQANIDINYRIRPWGNFGFAYQVYNLKFPDPYGTSTIQSFIAKAEIGFSTNLLWTTLFQYVDQSEFMGINSRLQWRFAPMSSLYLVYIDNYDVLDIPMESRQINNANRGLILKINYWY